MSDTVPTDSLLVWYATARSLQDAWLRDLARGALFVPTSNEHVPGDRVRLVIELPFCEGSVDIEGEVVTSLPTSVEDAGATPGVAVQTNPPIAELRERLEKLAGISLPERSEEAPVGDRPSRFSADASVVIELDGREYRARTVDISYNGMLALLPGIDLGEGSDVQVVLLHPRGEGNLSIEGQVARQTVCDHGVMAVGVRFNYGFDRVDEVTAFIDELLGYHRARQLASITGSLAETPLEDVLETFTSVSSRGTLSFAREGEVAKIAYRDEEILCATAGLVSGTKAIGRIFSWTDATFEFRPEIDPEQEVRQPVALHSAIVSAAVERDEVARLDLSRLGPEQTLTLDEKRLETLENKLDDLQREVAQNAGMGFPTAAILDILPENDATIYQALAALVEAGVLHLDEV